jgi:hypothetical protein
VNSKGFNYGFVEYDDPGAAERGMATLNGRRIHNNVSSHAEMVSGRRLIQIGNPRQLGLSVQQHRQGGHF